MVVPRWIEWYGNSGSGIGPDIKSGHGSVEDIVSHHVDVHKALDKHQGVIYGRAKALLQTHRRGDKTPEMHIVKWQPPTSLLDRYVAMMDSDSKQWRWSSVGLEYGHWIKVRGKTLGWVPGAWIIHDAAGLPHN